MTRKGIQVYDGDGVLWQPPVPPRDRYTLTATDVFDFNESPRLPRHGSYDKKFRKLVLHFNKDADYLDLSRRAKALEGLLVWIDVTTNHPTQAHCNTSFKGEMGHVRSSIGQRNTLIIDLINE